MKVSVVIPYRSDGGHRDLLWRWVLRRWFHFFPEIEIMVSDDVAQGERLNTGQARNLAAAAATGDILIFADADGTFAPKPLQRAIEKVAETGDWMIAEHFIHLTKEYTRSLLDKNPGIRLPRRPPCEDRVKRATTGGILVIRADVFREFGYDERWPGWGPDDFALAATLETLYRPGLYYKGGKVYHLWHPRGSYCWDTNWDLRVKYAEALGDADKLRELHEGIYVR